MQYLEQFIADLDPMRTIIFGLGCLTLGSVSTWLLMSFGKRRDKKRIAGLVKDLECRIDDHQKAVLLEDLNQALEADLAKLIETQSLSNLSEALKPEITVRRLDDQFWLDNCYGVCASVRKGISTGELNLLAEVNRAHASKVKRDAKGHFVKG